MPLHDSNVRCLSQSQVSYRWTKRQYVVEVVKCEVPYFLYATAAITMQELILDNQNLNYFQLPNARKMTRAHGENTLLFRRITFKAQMSDASNQFLLLIRQHN